MILLNYLELPSIAWQVWITRRGWLPKFEMLGEGKLGSSGISLWIVGPGLALIGGLCRKWEQLNGRPDSESCAIGCQVALTRALGRVTARRKTTSNSSVRPGSVLDAIAVASSLLQGRREKHLTPLTNQV